MHCLCEQFTRYWNLWPHVAYSHTFSSAEDIRAGYITLKISSDRNASGFFVWLSRVIMQCAQLAMLSGDRHFQQHPELISSTVKNVDSSHLLQSEFSVYKNIDYEITYSLVFHLWTTTIQRDGVLIASMLCGVRACGNGRIHL